MPINIKRSVQVGLLTLSVIGGLSTTTQAGIIPWLYDAIFGPPGSMMYGTGYRGYGMTYGAGYAPYAYGYGTGHGYSAAGCNSCGTSTATFYGPVSTCCTNDCNVPARSDTTTNRPTPVERPPEPSTFNDDPMNESDDGFRARGTDAPPTSSESFKIQQKPQPADDAVEEEKAAEPEDDPARVPALNLDSASTTRPLVAHRRTQWRAQFVTPSIARSTPTIDALWVPVSRETKIAGK